MVFYFIVFEVKKRWIRDYRRIEQASATLNESTQEVTSSILDESATEVTTVKVENIEPMDNIETDSLNSDQQESLDDIMSFIYLKSESHQPHFDGEDEGQASYRHAVYLLRPFGGIATMSGHLRKTDWELSLFRNSYLFC